MTDDLERILEQRAYQLTWQEGFTAEQTAVLLREDLPHGSRRTFTEEEVRKLAKAERNRRFIRRMGAM